MTKITLLALLLSSVSMGCLSAPIFVRATGQNKSKHHFRLFGPSGSTDNKFVVLNREIITEPVQPVPRKLSRQ